MKRFLAAVLLAVALPLAAAPAQPPVETVRLVSRDGDGMCSAIAVFPDIAITARHCVGKGIAVDGKPVMKVLLPVPNAGPDVAILFVPGLACPCAVLGKDPKPGDKGYAVGFPAKDGGKQKSVESGPVLAIAPPTSIAPWIEGYDDEFKGNYVLIDNPVLEHGMSGGALFVVQDDVWVVVGINAIGFPREPGKREFEVNGYVPISAIQALAN